MRVSLDYGQTYIEIPNDRLVEVLYEGVPVPGETQPGTLAVTLMNTAIITNVHVKDEAGQDVTVGTLPSLLDQVVHRAVAQTADQKARDDLPETDECSVTFTVPVRADSIGDAAKYALDRLRDRSAGPWNPFVLIGRRFGTPQVGGPVSSTAAEGLWAQLCQKQGCNQDSQVTILEGFLRQQGLFDQFSKYAQQHADDENGVDPLSFTL